MSFISEVKMPTSNVIISTPYSFKVKHFPASPSQLPSSDLLQVRVSFLPNSVIYEAKEERELGGRVQFYTADTIVFLCWFLLDVDFFSSGIHIYTGFLEIFSLLSSNYNS